VVSTRHTGQVYSHRPVYSHTQYAVFPGCSTHTVLRRLRGKASVGLPSAEHRLHMHFKQL